MNEFSLIDTYFKPLGEIANQEAASPNVVMGIGDDCALLAVKPGYQLAVSADTLVAGVHFPEATHPIDIGYKALAVNLSDLAAMGAEPAWFSLCLTLPEQNESWLKGFVQGLEILARQFNVPLVGGDTTKGPLTISIQVAGWVPQGSAMMRSGAKSGDLIYVAGALGWPYLGFHSVQKNRTAELALNQREQQIALERFLRPVPQVHLASVIRDHASAAIDVSDGLYADLQHMLTASGVGARIDVNAIPVADPLLSCRNDASQQSQHLDPMPVTFLIRL
ncbi:MAG: thiamine-phosphate kinase [Pseudomonadales bacterium]|nr:thiamine-phosphate kinase [Pseudomonadales bacterium]